MKNSSFQIIVAKDSENGIGKNGNIPWHIKEDMAQFKRITKGDISNKKNAVIMGRKTYESIGKLLPGRVNIIITSRELDTDTAVICRSVQESIDYVHSNDDIENAFIIGGSMIYSEFIKHPICNIIHVTHIPFTYDCDVFFPDIPSGFKLVESELGKLSDSMDTKYSFLRYEYVTDEQKYIDLVKDILEDGSFKNDRTGTGTFSKFGEFLKFDLSDNTLPLLTTKKIFTKGVFKELLWFIKGDTSSKTLERDGVNIWKGNSTKDFLVKRGLDYDEGTLGPVYGSQWRNWGAICDKNGNIEKNGIDQLQDCIDLIRNDPDSRRMIVSAWNVSDIDKMALPPCHMLFQFYVNDGKLSLSFTQRSVDIGLGSPFNIASYALLTHMVARITGLEPGTLTYFMGDAHIYKNHVDPLMEQITRSIRKFPKIRFTGDHTEIDDFKYEDIHVDGYYPHPTIKMPFAI